MSFKNIPAKSYFKSITTGIVMSLLLCLQVSNSFAQAPTNDDPCAATTLPVATTCNYQTFTNVNSTTSTGFPAPGCANFGGGDVWFQVTVPAGGALIFDTQAGGITDGGMAIYSGDCNTMTLIECDDDDSPNGFMPMITRTGLTPGSTIFIRVWEYGGDTQGTFGICVTTPPPPPSNDNCTSAIPVPVNADYQCAQTVNGTTVSATPTTGVPAPSCGAAGVNDDVWFSFVATGASHRITLSNVTGIATDMAMSVYSGTCAGLTHMQCSDPNDMVIAGLTAGQTYYLRVWTWTSTVGSSASFTVCIGTPPPPPSNDNCSAAVNLTVNPDLNCGVVTAGTTASALPSTGVPAPSCGPTGVNDDVWYSFVATTAQHVVSLLNVGGGNVTDMAMSIYSGTSCAALTHLQCSDPNTMTVGGLTVGQTYYVRVWTWSSTAGDYASFNICVGTPPPPPANDNPCNAITLTVNDNGTCNFQQFTNASATGTTGVPAPGCAGYQGGDVWFKVVVPCTGNITVDGNTGVVTDGGMAFYRGTCGNLTLLDCNDDGSNNGLMPKITANNLTVGDTIYIRFWEFGNDNNGTFSLCATTTLPPIVLPALPPSPTCTVAQPMCTSTTPYTIPNVSGQTPTSAPGGGIYGCLALIPNPTYYVLNIQTSGSIELTISQTNNAGAGVDVDFVVWGPFTNAATACTQLSASNNVDCSYSSDPVEIINIPNAIAGQVYILLVTNWGNQAGMITYQQTGGTGSSSCCPTNATNSSPVMCTGAGLNVNLFTSAVPNASYIWTGPNCYTSNQQNPTNAPVPSAPGQYVYSVTAYTATGQVCSDTTIVTVVARPTLAADTAFKICAGSTANLTTIYNTTNLTSTWTLNGNPVSNPAAVNVTGIYRLIGANTTGCTDTAFVNLTVDTVRSEISVSQIICTRTGRITVSNLTGIAPFEYSISSNPGVFQTANEFVANEGTYTITTRDSLGCTTTNQATITIIPEVTVNAGPDVSIVSGETAQLSATVSQPPTSIIWSPATNLNNTNILNPIANPTATTTYTISVTNSLGCVAADDIVVTVIPYCVRVKNAFTPNGDGINDTWEVYESFDCLRNVTINVFNRYGSLVHRDKNYTNKWNGTYDGKPVPDGTYYAVVDFTFISGKKISVKTDLTILR